ncbi:hypothetical protein PTKIN_Ptkin05aG0059400 [Pterospermum kingtungense]
MATFFSSPPFLSHPLTRIPHFSSSSQTPPPLPPNPSSQSNPQLSTTSSDQQQQPPDSVKMQQTKPPKPATTVETTDWIASSLTRRFGLGAGLAWAGFLAFGVISEQIKTRLEVSQQEANTRYYELRVGGGASPRNGDLVVINLKGKVLGSTGEVFVDTFDGSKKPLALAMGSRPYSKGMCEGVEYVLRTMKAGGKRRVIVPPNWGFGDNGADLGSGVQIPPSATLEYIVEVDKVSIAPA